MRIIIVICCALAVVAAACLGGCGPIWSAAVIVDATGKFRAAKDLDAKQYSPYEYYAAEEYLHKARQKESYSQYEQAVDYGKLAVAYAKQAIEKSHHAKSGMVPGAPHTGIQSIFGGQGGQQQPAPQYAPQQYAPPPQQYAPPAQQYAPPSQQYAPPAQQYVPPQPQYAPPQPQYVPPAVPEYDNYAPATPVAPQQPTF